jgi:hypothetical protein
MKANWIGHMLRRNCLQKHGRKDGGKARSEREDDEEEVSYYWMKRKRQNAGN